MTTKAKIGMGVAAFLVIAYLLGGADEPAPTPAAPAPVEAPAPAPAPEPAPVPEPEPEPDEETEADREIVELLGDEYFLNLVWGEMTVQEQAEICLGVGLFGADAAAQYIVAEAPSFDVDAVAAWLEDKCS